MKKQNSIHYFILFFILLAAILFRIANLDKPYGLWLDEMISFNTANKETFLDIFNHSLKRDLHAPFYYILLFFWMKLFGQADLTLRLFSVAPGILTVLLLYLTGKELDSKKTGLYAAFFGAINSLLIYYSQEVRIYSLISFLSILTIFFVIKIIKKPCKLNYAGFVLSNILLLYTHTIGFIFVFFEILIFGIYIYIKKKDILKNYILSSLTIAALFIPYTFHIFKIASSPRIGISTQWWCDINLSKIFFSIGDLFSPLLLNIYGAHLDYIDFLFSPVNIVISIIPTIIALIGIVIAVIPKQKWFSDLRKPKFLETSVISENSITNSLPTYYNNKNVFINLIFLICICFLIVFTGLYFKGKAVFITRYIIEVSPLLILIFTYGLLKIKNKLISTILIYIYIVITLSCFLVFSASAFNDNRISGLKTPITLLEEYELDNNSAIISMFYRKTWFSKYYPEEQGASFNSIHWKNYSKFLSSEEKKPFKNFTKEKFYTKLKPFISGENTKYYENKLKKEFINPLPSNKYLIILNRKRFHSYNNKELEEIARNNLKYQDSKMALMLFSRFTETLLKICDEELKFIEKKEELGWELYFYQKP